MKTKKCTKCLEEKDIEEFNFEHKKDPNKRISRCKDCQYKKIEEHRLKTIENSAHLIIPEDYRKECCQCKKTKPVKDFNKNKGRSDGLQTNCRECNSLNKKEYKQTLIAKNKALSNEEIYQNFPSGFKQCCACKKDVPVQEYYRDNSAKFGLLARCPKCLENQADNLDPTGEKRKGYYKKCMSKPESKKKRNEYTNNKRKTNIQFKIKTTLSGRIYGALKSNKKSARTMELIGCSIEFLISHLESQFEDWMTFENHGNSKYEGHKTWHIDHIIPCRFYNLEDPEQQKICFNWRNLQPLESKENSSKQDRMEINGEIIYARNLKKKNPTD